MGEGREQGDRSVGHDPRQDFQGTTFNQCTTEILRVEGFTQHLGIGGGRRQSACQRLRDVIAKDTVVPESEPAVAVLPRHSADHIRCHKLTETGQCVRCAAEMPTNVIPERI